MLLKHKYLFISLLLFAITAFNIPTHAQAAARLDSLKNKFALQFQISQNFNLSNFQGNTFSGKYNIGNRSALRLGLSLDINNTEIEYTETRFDTTANFFGDSKSDMLSVTVKTQYIHYVPGLLDVAFFLGGGPFVTMASGTSETIDTAVDPAFSRKDDIDRFTAGLDFLIGVEWLFAEDMSLSAEYGIRFSYFDNERSMTEQHRIRKVKEKAYRISRGDLNFGLTVYF